MSTGNHHPNLQQMPFLLKDNFSIIFVKVL